jgi:hypothetical protein
MKSLQKPEIPERGALLRLRTTKKSRSNAPRSIRNVTFCRGLYDVLKFCVRLP